MFLELLSWNRRSFAIENLSRFDRCCMIPRPCFFNFKTRIKNRWLCRSQLENQIALWHISVNYGRCRAVVEGVVKHRLDYGKDRGRQVSTFSTSSRRRFTHSSIPAEDTNWQKATSRSQTVWVPLQTINLAGISGFRFLPRHDWSVY